jgi:hypothetical protein
MRPDPFLARLDSDRAPAMVLYGSWENRPPAAEPEHGTFALVRLPDGQRVVEQPAGTTRLAGDLRTQVHFGPTGTTTYDGDGWIREPGGLLAHPAAWFRDPAAEVDELPGREAVAGRACSRFLVRYSPHSVHAMTLWVDDEWSCVLAARTVRRDGTDARRFEVHVDEIRPATEEQVRRRVLHVV